MDDWKEYVGKTVDEALNEAIVNLQAASDSIEYEIIEREAKGFLGLKNKPARIRARLKPTVEGSARIFLTNVFRAMNINAEVEVSFDEAEETISINILGEDMGVLIGKRGQTLDSLQYLTSLVVNKKTEGYLKVKLDTENYRERRKETLENLAKNIASKVKRTHKPVLLEPMNPYERRIIHSTLQNDRYVETHSEGDEPFRKVVVAPKKGVREYNSYDNGYKSNGGHSGNGGYGNRGGYGGSNGGYRSRYDNGRYGYGKVKKYSKKEFHKKYGGNTKDYSTDYKKDYAAYLEQKAAAKAAAKNAENTESGAEE